VFCRACAPTACPQLCPTSHPRPQSAPPPPQPFLRAASVHPWLSLHAVSCRFPQSVPQSPSFAQCPSIHGSLPEIPYLRRSVAVRNPPPKSLPALRRWKGINPSMEGTRASPFHPRRCADCGLHGHRFAPQSVDARNACFPLPSSALRELQIAWSSFRPSSLPASDGRVPRSASPPCKYLICCAQSLADFFLMLPRVLSSLTGFPWRLFQG
jgi:hypothetical protein